MDWEGGTHTPYSGLCSDKKLTNLPSLGNSFVALYVNIVQKLSDKGQMLFSQSCVQILMTTAVFGTCKLNGQLLLTSVNKHDIHMHVYVCASRQLD